jgi:hypothetical protein
MRFSSIKFCPAVASLLSYVWLSISLCGSALYASDQTGLSAWQGFLRDSGGHGLSGAVVELSDERSARILNDTTKGDGSFSFSEIVPGTYSLSARWQGRSLNSASKVSLRPGDRLNSWLEFSDKLQQLVLRQDLSAESPKASGGERLSSQEVSELPLNKRDFSQLLLLAAGTMTDTNGATNFTQQFAVNGQRGTASVFAMDGIHTSDPEMGGSTFSNFNVDAIQEIQSSSGVMPAEVGRGAAGYTNILTRSGSSQVHGSVFEFLRNASLDARNFFDRQTVANPNRIPPFIRNEFGFTNGGPVVLPGIYDGRDQTFYFGQYQGFRQILGTTQILSVPTPLERQGRNTTAFPGDTLWVPVNPQIAQVLARYPLPNDPQGPYGERTYATSSKVSTTTDQFSIRIDHRISDKSQLFSRFNFNNVSGPLTNPNQTAIDPSFAVRFLDHQRNFGLTYARTISSNLTSESSFGFLRSTPLFPTINQTQPALKFADGLYEAFNSPAGTVLGSFGNLFQVRQNLAYVHKSHIFKMGFEARFNRDTTVFAYYPNGEYTFGGGAAYAPLEIRSLSGRHDIHFGEPLPDALTGFLTGTPFAYTTSAAPPLFPQGDRLGESAIRRESYNFYFQDTWKLRSQVVLNYGLRYEVNTRNREANHLTSSPIFVGPDGRETFYWAPGTRQNFLINPNPPYRRDLSGWGPRLAIDWRVAKNTVVHAGGTIMSITPSLFQTNFLTGGFPYIVNPFITAAPGSPVPFQNSAARFELPPILNPQGEDIFASGRSKDVPPNTEADILRFVQDLAAGIPGQTVTPLSIYGMSRDFRDGYIGTYSAGLEQDFAGIKLSASYVATVGVRLSSIFYPNSYAGADRAFAPFTQFDANGKILGGYGPEYLMTSRSHSSFHSLQTSLGKTSLGLGLSFQASYTFSKSLDDTSSALGGFFSGSSGPVLQAAPQNPQNINAEKGPSTFDVTHVFALSLFQALPLDRVDFLRPLGRKLTAGWQILNISTLTSGSPFSIYSGVQQTGAGADGADRPDQVGRPVLSTSRNVREDYLGFGEANPSYFSIPIKVPGGSGPNQGRFGTLGRNTFRGPAFHNFDLAIIKDTSFWQKNKGERLTLQFRAEFFNVFNLVNLGLPANIVLGSGFGLINRTVGTSRQIQFSLKLIY